MRKKIFNYLLIVACIACIGASATLFGGCNNSNAGIKDNSNNASVLPDKEVITKISDNDLMNVIKTESIDTTTGAGEEIGAGNDTIFGTESGSGSITMPSEDPAASPSKDLETLIKNYEGDLFTVEKTAHIVLSDTDATSGITFTAKINAYYDNASYGMFVVPYVLVKSLAANTDYIANIYSRLPESVVNTIRLPYDICIPYQANEAHYISVSLVDIKNRNFDIDYVAIPYVEFTDGETFTRYYTAADANGAACVSKVLAKAYGELVGTEQAYAQRMATRALECFKGPDGALSLVNSAGETLNGVTVYKSAEGLTVKEADKVPVKYSTNSDAIEIDENTGAVNILNAAKSVTVVATFCQYNASVTFDIASKTLVVGKSALNLLENKTVDGTANAQNVTEIVVANYFGDNDEDLGLATGLTLNSANPAVAKINEEGAIEAVSSGNTVITVSAPDATNTVDVNVTVWVGIATPADMDALSLITYYNDKATATALMRKNYLLMNDIDYSTHVRNFILPIASPSGAQYNNSASAAGTTDCYILGNGNILWAIACSIRAGNPMNMKVAHYSLTWKALLGLTDQTIEVNGNTVHYLTDSEGNEFKGINPNLVPFSGKLNGNGYSIKNAWIMADNFVFLYPNDSYSTIGVGNCFMGINYGSISNIGFESVKLPNVNVTYEMGDVNGLQTQMTYKQYWHNASQSSMTINGQYCGLPADSYVKANSSTPEGICLQAVYSRRDKASSMGSALIVSNMGSISNLYFDYASCSTTGGWNDDRARGDGLVFVNTASVSNCLVVRHDPADELFSESFDKSKEYAAQYLLAYTVDDRFGGKPSFNNVAAYNDTTSTVYNVKIPENYTNPSDGSGITVLDELPQKDNNAYVSLVRII